MVQNSPDTESCDRAVTCLCRGPGQTKELGARLARALAPGDCVLLSGPLGAGKSHLARAVIRALLGDPDAPVPSPSYTLVNVYDVSEVEIWHADLYRLGAVEELDELGLDQALDSAILLIEWGERWMPPPSRRLCIKITSGLGDVRTIKSEAVGPGWDRLLHEIEDMA